MIIDLEEKRKKRKHEAIKKLFTEGMTPEELDYWEPRIPELKWDNIRRDLKAIEEED